MAVVKNQVCIVCGNHFTTTEGLFLRDLNNRLQAEIRHRYKYAKNSSFICLKDLQQVRLSEMQSMIDQDLQVDKEINSKLEKKLSEQTYQVRNINDTVDQQLTSGQKLADAVAKFGGSWAFIVTFVIVLIVWMALNVTHLFGIKFDPYPFILLNLFLSCVAAIQAPIIMMSQNRQAERDRVDAENDYHTNTKSEMEIHILHQKVDQMNEVQWPHILDVQKMQIEVLSEIENEIQSLKADQKAPRPGSRTTRHPSRHAKEHPID
ncbi:DUF1003 domain-containing protein [Lactobacillus selangorensis]|nr:DUF1003 domain-containing protein [Lactobacillus selangorensis]